MKKNKILILAICFVLASTILFAGDFATQSTVAIMLGAFVVGMFLTFTPYVLPIVSSITGQGKNVTKTKAVMLAVYYIFGTAVT